MSVKCGMKGCPAGRHASAQTARLFHMSQPAAPATPAAPARPAVPARPSTPARMETFGEAMRRHDEAQKARWRHEGFGPDDPYAPANQPQAAPPAPPAPPAPARKARKSRKPAYRYEGPSGEVDENGRCLRCAGTGQFITGTLNGKPVGPGGICFRCVGKGRQSDCGEVAHGERADAIDAGTLDDLSACCDRTRNVLYDTYGIRVHIG